MLTFCVKHVNCVLNMFVLSIVLTLSSELVQLLASNCGVAIAAKRDVKSR